MILGYSLLKSNLNIESQFPWTFPGVIIGDFTAISLISGNMYQCALRRGEKQPTGEVLHRPAIKRWDLADFLFASPNLALALPPYLARALYGNSRRSKRAE